MPAPASNATDRILQATEIVVGVLGHDIRAGSSVVSAVAGKHKDVLTLLPPGYDRARQRSISQMWNVLQQSGQAQSATFWVLFADGVSLIETTGMADPPRPLVVVGESAGDLARALPGAEAFFTVAGFEAWLKEKLQQRRTLQGADERVAAMKEKMASMSSVCNDLTLDNRAAQRASEALAENARRARLGLGLGYAVCLAASAAFLSLFAATIIFYPRIAPFLSAAHAWLPGK
jgi:hypothetical protein